jgi:hypothetical protein
MQMGFQLPAPARSLAMALLRPITGAQSMSTTETDHDPFALARGEDDPVLVMKVASDELDRRHDRVDDAASAILSAMPSELAWPRIEMPSFGQMFCLCVGTLAPENGWQNLAPAEPVFACSEEQIRKIMKRYRSVRLFEGWLRENESAAALFEGKLDELITEFRQRAERSRLAKEANGYTALTEEADKLMEQCREVNRKLRTTIATTAAGVIVQLEWLRECCDDDEGFDTVIAGVRALDDREARP